ncbi:peptidase M28-like protein [Chitinophaga skermanii]|uniref:Carboxypeptidase Q n=1 Tax=Chitinophaga skermanii TaxID=331697 RepID=A0A327QV16_9BACT|nr:M20/M25/M40 family metallo-hydrolase [Chitinophaga skermanii]RAJ08526.1 peptidase M28-like protein [Chitinophaga skermanii]
MKTSHHLLALGLFLLPTISQAQEKFDEQMIAKIREEGLQRSKVMDIAFQLTDVNGPRLTATAGYMKAANYAKKQLGDWGLTNTQVDPWGEFGKGWELKKSYLALTAPYYKPIIAYPKSWTASTKGTQSVEVVVVSAAEGDTLLAAYKGKLKGKLILIDATGSYKQSFKPDATRYADEDLQKMAEATMPPAQTGGPRVAQGSFPKPAPGELFISMHPAALRNLKAMAKSEGAVGFLSTTTRAHDGTLFVQGAGSYKKDDPENMLDVVIGIEDYLPIVRLAAAKVPVKLDVDMQSIFQTKDLQGYNVIAEIKGTDPKLADEVVMLGGHLDSWHSSTGATDNAAGCAVMMEAVRILKAVGAQPRRTIRIALWSGEEQGLLGSRAYVKKTFADRADMKLLPAHEKFSAYYNLDNGTGKIRGIYLQQNEACAPIFKSWLAPFADLGAATVTIRNTGGTDHQSFDAVGLPGFQFIQDGMEYNTRTHHTNVDSYDHLSADDLKQAATIVAAMVYNTAQRDEKLPRKALPAAQADRRP